MDDIVFNRVVRLAVANTSEELDTVLGHLPHGVRFGVAFQLDEVGEAYRYESARHCAYYLYRQEQGIVIWRWSYVATQSEANRLRALIASVEEPLDPDSANSIFERATRRSVSSPRPLGMELHAVNFGDYPYLYANGTQPPP